MPYASKSHFSLYLCGFALSVKFTGSKHCGIGMDSSDGHSTAHVSFARQPIRASPSFRLRSENLNSVRLRRTFEAFDRNGDGLITTGELGQALQKLGMPIALSDLQSTVAPFVKTGRAGLDFEDFSALHRSLGDQMFGADALPEGNDNAEEEEEEEDLKEAFSVFDEDGDGYISAAELHGVIRRLGLPGAGDVGSCERMIFAVDENKDGRVDFGEFKHMIGTVTVRGS